jgi:hypothetical protein
MMLDKQVLKTEERHVVHKLFLPQEVVFGMKYGLVVFRKGTVTNDNFHGERCNRILTQMSGCKDQDEIGTSIVPELQEISSSYSKVEENTNINVFEEIEENYSSLSLKYAPV